MVSMVRQILGFTLAVVGFLGTITVCVLPMWRVMALKNCGLGMVQTFWEGLWMVCVTHRMGKMHCSFEMPVLTQDIQAARVLMVIAIIMSAVGISLGIAWGKCNFVKNPASKAKVAIATGIIFIIAGVLVLVPVCWFAYTIIGDSYEPSYFWPERRQLGAAVYIGWGTAALLILGGGLFCSSCSRKESPEYPDTRDTRYIYSSVVDV